jgi:hypothetical protein
MGKLNMGILFFRQHRTWGSDLTITKFHFTQFHVSVSVSCYDYTWVQGTCSLWFGNLVTIQQTFLFLFVVTSVPFMRPRGIKLFCPLLVGHFRLMFSRPGKILSAHISRNNIVLLKNDEYTSTIILVISVSVETQCTNQMLLCQHI